MTVPFDLDSGLHLERSKVLLPWTTSIDRLCGIGSPEIYRHSSATNLSWRDELVLGGLSAQVSAMSAAGPNVFYLSIGSAKSARSEYTKLLGELSLRLGAPHVTTVDCGYPWTEWAWGDVRVSLRIAERFTEYVALMVSKGVA